MQKFYSINTEELEREFRNLHVNYQPAGRGSHIPELCEACQKGICNSRATNDSRDENHVRFSRRSGQSVTHGQRDVFVKWVLTNTDSSHNTRSDSSRGPDGSHDSSCGSSHSSNSSNGTCFGNRAGYQSLYNNTQLTTNRTSAPERRQSVKCNNTQPRSRIQMERLPNNQHPNNNDGIGMMLRVLIVFY